LTVSYATSHLVLNADELLQGVIEAALCLPVHVITGSEGSTQIKLFFLQTDIRCQHDAHIWSVL